jgi:type VI secretion system protein ImpK
MRETTLDPKSLAGLSTDLFLLIIRMRLSADLGSFETVYKGAVQLFSQFEEQCKLKNIDPEIAATAKYALAAFMDETILNCRWPFKERWADNPLQLEFFGTYLAGEIFYDKLDEIRQRPETNPDLLEIYYLCMLLGFRGKYGVTGEEKLKLLIEQVSRELGAVRPPTPAELSPHWAITDKPQVAPTGNLPKWAVFTCWGLAALAVVLYLAMFFSLRSGVSNLKDKIPNPQSSLIGNQKISVS